MTGVPKPKARMKKWWVLLESDTARKGLARAKRVLYGARRRA
jgi:hypothetical protein